MPENFDLDPILTKNISYNVKITHKAYSNSSITMNTEIIYMIKLKYKNTVIL